jgi:hypothetical protein
MKIKVNDNQYIHNLLIQYDYMRFRHHYMRQLKQSGGSKNYKIDFKENTYTFRRTEKYTYILFGEDEMMCLIILIDKYDGIAVITGITANEIKCKKFFPDNHGSNMLELAIKFIKQNKNKFKVYQIQLSDNSAKLCKGSSYIDFALFLTLTTGHTWYGKHGFKPLKKTSQNTYFNNYKTMQKLRIKDVKFHKIIKKMNKFTDNKKLVDKFEKYTKKYKDELFIDVFRKFFIKSKFNKYCGIIGLVEDLLQKYTGVISLKGITYYMDI